MVSKSIFAIVLYLLFFSNLIESKNQNIKKIKIKFLHFEGCPNSDTLLNNLQLATQQFNKNIELLDIIVDTPELAKKYKFLGSPTILLNGKDIEDLEFGNEPNLSCRIYINGLPSVDFIINKIQLEMDKK